MGIFAAAIVFLFIGLVQFGDGAFIRPHPALWRIILAASVLYEMFLVFILFQNATDARSLFKYIDPSLGTPLPDRSYAENCEFTVSNIWNSMDAFVLAHSIGWFFKAIILRDYWFCWILSIMFEFMEYSLQHQLANFAECWWDHWILDVLICNWLGTYAGMKFCEYFSMRHYSWRGIKQIPDYRGKVKRTVQQFTPHSWTTFHWGATESFKNYAAVIVLMILALMCELNAFYLKTLLWLPPEHYLNVSRLLLFFFMATPAVRELYQYLMDKSCKRVGAQAWLTIACIMTEVLIILKFGRNEFPNPAPVHIKIFWTVLLSLVGIYPVWQFLIKPRLEKTEKKD
ncbi:phosphatidyl serine synthase [Basidiobolus meristosporus CBS 931.73]|uniref:Phosphatidyl serine synthase n=1 Tax=Basidiobolus meristosporus CBS 931.73 TaxID=1314790 RepID=A0A1Y1YRS8_9FUNG|nr:phosphatidyl serine synthase [Basidiobolus meristosporus CBS 931.73]|eukprot:ORY00524.1 phosphatidyl serine synthase [Basidiobolus meristosporus CBS 931.73]